MGTLFYILIFPGFLFLIFFALGAEFLDRRIYARLQNRVGPPWFQPFADVIKLFGKEDMMPAEANPWMFTLAPLISLTAAVTAFIYIPLWQVMPAFSFQGILLREQDFTRFFPCSLRRVWRVPFYNNPYGSVLAAHGLCYSGERCHPCFG